MSEVTNFCMISLVQFKTNIDTTWCCRTMISTDVVVITLAALSDYQRPSTKYVRASICLPAAQTINSLPRPTTNSDHSLAYTRRPISQLLCGIQSWPPIVLRSNAAYKEAIHRAVNGHIYVNTIIKGHSHNARHRTATGVTERYRASTL